ncbi:MAG TPA: ATP-binding protein [Acidobacteriota bacterium]|jgi:hypothetical protein
MATTTLVEPVPLIRVDKALNSLRSSGYTLEAAIGEPLDNAFEAGANEIRVRLIETLQTIQKGKKSESLTVVDKIAISDDGIGMPADVLQRCLVLGESTRYNSRKGMGRFGVGGTLGAISQCRRVEVYSRDNSSGPFLYTYIDLDEIAEGTLTQMITPEARDLPAEFADLPNSKTSGTLVVWSKCDRLSVAPQASSRKALKAKDVRTIDRVQTDLIKWVARTYRYFLAGGRVIEVNGAPVAAHDPLYLLDSRFADDPKATLEFDEEVPWPLASDPTVMAPIKVRITLLPEQWRPKRGSGAETTFNRERRIIENEPLSVVRANREIFFDIIPRFYPDGVREIARFIGIEISFDPVLDEAFRVRNVKRGVEPVEELRHDLRKIIRPVMETLVGRIRKKWGETANAEKQQKGVHNAAEEIAAEAEKTSVKPRAGRDIPAEERERRLDDLADKTAKNLAQEEPEKALDEKKTRKELRERFGSLPFSIIDDQWPGNEFFSTEHLGEKIIVTYNNKHPFFSKIYAKVLAAARLHSDDTTRGAMTEEELGEIARIVQIGLDLLIVAYAKGEAMDDDKANQELYSTLRTQWGLSLSQMVQRVPDIDV